MTSGFRYDPDGVSARKSRFVETQIVGILNEVKVGESVKDACREHGISNAEPVARAGSERSGRLRFYNWRASYGGMVVSQVKRLKELEKEQRKLKNMYAELSLGHRILKEAVKNALRPAEKHTLVDHTVSESGASLLRGCRILGFSRASYAYQPDTRLDRVA